MKCIFPVFFGLVLLCSCASPPANMDRPANAQALTDPVLEKDAKTLWFEGKAEEQSRIAKEASHLGMEYASHPTGERLRQIHDDAIQVHNLAIEIGQESELENIKCWDCLPAATGRIVKDAAAQTACIILLNTAKTFAVTGGKANKENAKQLYRTVITTYVGFNYTGYVKQAEFGLQDLKETK
ncbi:MAG: hypothetical protein ACLQVJ_21990 [Syntrophobacteraceae bacterium]